MRADARRRREAIINAARVVFNAGPDAGTMEDVARVAKVGIATVYRNFSDKNALLIALIGEILTRVIELQEGALKAFDEQPDTALENYAESLAALGLAPLLASAREDSVQELLPHFDEQLAVIRRHNRDIVGRAQQHGILTTEVTAEFLIAGIIQVSRPSRSALLPPIPDFEAQLLKTFLRGLHP